MLEYPPCPACGGELPLKELFGVWDPASKYDRRGTSAGLECPSCFAKLKPKLLRANILMMMALGASFVLMAAVLRLFRGNDLAFMVTVLVFIASILWIQYSLLRHLITWRVAAPDEQVTFMLPTRAQRDQAEAEARAEAEAERRDAAFEAAEYPPWKCLNCREENPGRFELCWKCESEQLGPSSDGNFRREAT
jgi:hypothetical protein